MSDDGISHSGSEAWPRGAEPGGLGGIRPADDRTLVVAVGASAGGLDALKRLLGAISPEASLALVVVQHLSPSHESLLTSALRAASPLAVVEVNDGMPLAARRVHVIPPNVALVLDGGRLRLHRRDPSDRPPMPIDTFMRSLAAERKAGAVGVVLSGTGSDGTQGLRAIRDAGGRTYAQAPATAAHDGMPRSAIAADVVDQILAPEAIAADLAALADGAPAPSEREVAPGPADEDAFPQILQLLRQRTAVDVSGYKPTTLRRRIARRMALVRATKDTEYLRRLREDPEELDALQDELFVHVTTFFRDPEVFAALDEHVFPALLRGDRPRDAPIRLWVPGCSSGEEAYSLAIAAREFLEARGRGNALNVFGSDISERAIRRARAAEYAPDVAEHVSEDRLRRFFEPTAKGYRIARPVREACIFVRHDLTSDPPFSRIDLLSCRNVLIYFDSALQRRVVPVFHYALNEPGFLVLGRSESLSGFGELFDIADPQRKIYARRPGAGQLRARSPRVAGAVERGPRPAVAPPARGAPDLHRALDLLLLSRYVPAAVLVNDALEIVQVRGRTGRYLEPAPGTASLSLLKMARGRLAADLARLVERAREENAPARKDGVRLEDDGDVAWLDLEVAPVEGDGSSTGSRQFAVVFRERGAPREPGREAEARGGDDGATVAELRDELAASKAYESAVIEQYAVTNQALAESNEELQATNEELQSANEELETAKEELQSSNEELTTVNDELQARYHEVNELGDDLLNLVTSADIPIVIVDRDRKIRRFTPNARGAFNLIAGDVGRPIAEIRPSVDAPELDAWIAEVIETVTVKEVEVRDRDGRWQRLQIRPYQTADRHIDGAVVSLVDVDALRRAVTDARRARDFAAAALETVPVPVLVLDAALRVTSTNHAYHEVFRSTPRPGAPLSDLGPGPWQTPELAGRLREALERGVPLKDVELEYELPDDGRRIAVVAGRVVPEALDGGQSLVVAIQDVTERRRLEEERARARAQEAQRFLNEAGAAMLPESLDYEATLATVAHLVVPRFADWCIVDLLEPDGAIRQAAVAHADPAKERRARELRRRFGPEAQPEKGVAWVIRTGNPVLHPEIEDVGWVAAALGAEHPEVLRELGARSYLSVPLHGRKGVIGAISLVRGLPGRRYGPEDLAVAEGLGQRAGLAVENARLYLAAREAIVARDDFLAIAAHELRTPLSTLSLQLQTLAGPRGVDLNDAVVAGKIARAIRQTRRLASLIDSLLEVSRITAGRLKLHRERTDLGGVIGDVAARFRGAAEAEGCTLTVRAEGPVTGTWDPARLDQVVTNLLQNAIRYAPGAPIELSVEGDQRWVRLAVRDHGPGIPPERRVRVFDRFEKGGARSQEGLGLGLYITRQIVEAHGGAIGVLGELDGGTTFVVQLPRGADPARGTSP
jgi:two-component system, chemotaxis family, CheB/CheR fusion protein